MVLSNLDLGHHKVHTQISVVSSHSEDGDE